MKASLLFSCGFLLTACANFVTKPTPVQPHLELFTQSEPVVWGHTENGDAILAGGFSGLMYLGETGEGKFQFMTHTDRGPNAEPLFISGVGRSSRPFLLPNFQPRLVKIEADRKTKTYKIVEEILLTDPLGNPLSGRPQWVSDSKTERSDEKAVDLKGNLLATDLMGIDPEGLTRDSEGFYWLVEEYRPSILKFDPKGRLIKRFIPKNSLPIAELQKIKKKFGSEVVIEALPEVNKYRKSNRGFEGIVFSNGKLYAVLQSPLEIPGSVHEKNVKVLEFDPQTEQVTGESIYPLEKEGVDKIGDLATDPDSQQLVLIEQNSKVGAQSIHLLRMFKPESSSSAIHPETVLSLAALGYDFAEKVEGLAFVSKDILAVINDNDFGVVGDFDLSQNKVPLSQERQSVLGLIFLR